MDVKGYKNKGKIKLIMHSRSVLWGLIIAITKRQFL